MKCLHCFQALYQERRAMSDSDSSSSSLPSNILVKSKMKNDAKNKTKSRSTAKPDPQDDPTWPYQPPEGMALLENTEVDEEWDYDTFKKDSELELWLIRVPNGVKPKHLENLSFDLPGSSSHHQNTKVGVLNRKQESYDVWNLGSSSLSGGSDIGGVEVGRMDDETTAGGGEEIRGLTCLLPRKKKRGELYIAPRPITRHLIISAQHPKPSSSEQSPETSIPTQNPPRFSYPKELLKHRFVAFGSNKTIVNDANDAHGVGGDGDVEMRDAPTKSDKQSRKSDKKSTERESKQSKETKKRKTADETVMPTPKKQKKLKR
ncbi:hypothetical protein J3R30DRAFT_3294445 [Lentinula aciculospora]|uniref:Uncharacterized protein n=1 Tax=Lentinula aciculospora TaxID=153920 RepID=A0A9W9A7L1_9AGAR|nr:hypothetical protein J3R30DRAFT_3294445 [Lentinula aciculospora]